MPLTTAYANDVGTARRVVRGPDVLPATAQEALFTVTGHVRILALGGEFTTAASATATNGSYVFNPPAGSDVALCAVGALASLAVNATIGITGTIATALQTGLARVDMSVPQVVGPGTIDFLTSATNTGVVSHWCVYEPLTADGGVVPTAI